MHGKTYASLNWRDRATEVKLRAERVNDTLADADAALSPYGIRLINERGVHIYEDWPGLDRRKVSGSVWNPIGLAFLVALMRNPSFLLVVRLRKPSQWKPEKPRCAHRTWKSAKQLVAASREPVLFSHLGIGRGMGRGHCCSPYLAGPAEHGVRPWCASASLPTAGSPHGPIFRKAFLSDRARCGLSWSSHRSWRGYQAAKASGDVLKRSGECPYR